jgi:hypothetical protein
MLVLFDQGTPVPIRPFLVGHTVETTAQRGWDKLKNGELLEAAEEAGFEVLVTPDKNIRFSKFSASQNSARRAGQPPMATAQPIC